MFSKQTNCVGCLIKDKLNGLDFISEGVGTHHAKTSWFRFPKPILSSENFIPDFYKPLAGRTKEIVTVRRILTTQ